METTAKFSELQSEWNSLQDGIKELRCKQLAVEEKMRGVVRESVEKKFANFKDGDKVRVTLRYWSPDPRIDITEKILYFHNPTKMSFFSGLYEGDYEIPFHSVNKDGSEGKRNDLYENHIPVDRIVKMIKL